MNILVVEDEPKVQRFIKQALEQAGHVVESIDSLNEVEEYADRIDFEIIILDRLLGRQDSLPNIPRLRGKFPKSKILILSALGEVDDRVSGLEMGADDYLSKPFHVAELLARVRSLGRREKVTSGRENNLNYEGLSLSLERQEVKFADKLISLTAKEFKLLSLLMQKPKKIFSRAELLDRVWGVNADPGSNVVEVSLNRLRAKLTEAGCPSLIQTRRGSGYCLGKETSEE